MSPSVAEALRDGARRLVEAGVAGAARDARRLMVAALGCPASALGLREREAMPADAAVRFCSMIGERARFRPVAQIVGWRAFWGRDFAVTGAVLDPRPETETLVACALAGPMPRQVLDIGTGSGAILVTLLAEWPAAAGTGTDCSEAALRVARQNARRHGVGGRARWVLTTWAEGVAGAFDLVVANPPYIPAADVAALAADVRDWEPYASLTPGPTGLEAYGAIAAGLGALMGEGGRTLLEFGAGQADAVAGIFTGAGFRVVALHDDLDGRPRVIEVGRSPRSREV